MVELFTQSNRFESVVSVLVGAEILRKAVQGSIPFMVFIGRYRLNFICKYIGWLSWLTGSSRYFREGIRSGFAQ
ncbi:hypothetical protein D3C84_1187590 [compost metagenome]